MYKKNVTIRDVAKKAEVSATTVSYVIHNKNNIPELTKKRVVKAMTELNYLPNTIARRLVTRKSQMIALLVPSLDNPFFAELYNGVDSFIENTKSEFKVMIGNIRYSVEKEISIIRSFRQDMMD